jgi:hypothetical protein
MLIEKIRTAICEGVMEQEISSLAGAPESYHALLESAARQVDLLVIALRAKCRVLDANPAVATNTVTH